MCVACVCVRCVCVCARLTPPTLVCDPCSQVTASRDAAVPATYGMGVAQMLESAGVGAGESSGDAGGDPSPSPPPLTPHIEELKDEYKKACASAASSPPGKLRSMWRAEAERLQAEIAELETMDCDGSPTPMMTAEDHAKAAEGDGDEEMAGCE